MKLAYPIIVKPMLGGKLILFPDFPGCSTPCTFKQKVVSCDILEQTAIAYLITWITIRLRQHRQIARPYSYPMPTLRDDDRISSVELPDSISYALRFIWLRKTIGGNHAFMQSILGINTLRYEQIELMLAQPTPAELQIVAHVEEILKRNSETANHLAASS